MSEDYIKLKDKKFDDMVKAVDMLGYEVSGMKYICDQLDLERKSAEETVKKLNEKIKELVAENEEQARIIKIREDTADAYRTQSTKDFAQIEKLNEAKELTNKVIHTNGLEIKTLKTALHESVEELNSLKLEIEEQEIPDCDDCGLKQDALDRKYDGPGGT